MKKSDKNNYITISGIKIEKKSFFIVLAFLLILLISLIVIFIVSNIDTKKYKYVLTCPEGYELNNKECTRIFKEVEASVNYSCNNNYTLEEDKCITYEYNNRITTSAVCPSGYTETSSNSSICYKRIIEENPTVIYYCNAGYTLSGDKCIMNGVGDTNTSSSCPGFGVYNPIDDLCVTVPTTLRPSTTCPSGYSPYRVGNNVRCVAAPYRYTYSSNGYTAIDALKSYQCPDSTYVANYETGTCIKVLFATVQTVYSCADSGFQYENGRCVKKISIAANANYNCDNGFILKDNRCVKYGITIPKEVKVEE